MSGQDFSRRPKIAHLPHDVRQELLLRTELGEPAAKLVGWLNSLPATKQRMAQDPKGRLISLKNFSSWRRGAYYKWTQIRDAKAAPAEVGTAGASLLSATPPLMADLLKSAEESFHYIAGADWRRQRCAVFATVCAEHARFTGQIRPVKLLRLLVAKYAGLPLAGGKRLRLSKSALSKALGLWVAAEEKTPALFEHKCGPAVQTPTQEAAR